MASTRRDLCSARRGGYCDAEPLLMVTNNGSAASIPTLKIGHAMGTDFAGTLLTEDPGKPRFVCTHGESPFSMDRSIGVYGISRRGGN